MARLLLLLLVVAFAVGAVADSEAAVETAAVDPAGEAALAPERGSPGPDSDGSAGESAQPLTRPDFDAAVARLLAVLPPPAALLLRAHVRRLLRAAVAARRASGQRHRRRLAPAAEPASDDTADEQPSNASEPLPLPLPLSAEDLLLPLQGAFPFALPPPTPLSGAAGAGRAAHLTQSLTSAAPPAHGVTPAAVWSWREAVRGMQAHAWGSYVSHAYPADELRPLTCDGRRWDARERGTLDDVLGGYGLTLVDSLDALAVAGDTAGFRAAVSAVVRHVRLDAPVQVSVFEAAIRVLGGLLSGHQLAASESWRLWDARAHCGPALGWRAAAASTPGSSSNSSPPSSYADADFYAYLASNATARDVCGRLLCGCGAVRREREGGSRRGGTGDGHHGHEGAAPAHAELSGAPLRFDASGRPIELGDAAAAAAAAAPAAPSTDDASSHPSPAAHTHHHRRRRRSVGSGGGGRRVHQAALDGERVCRTLLRPAGVHSQLSHEDAGAHSHGSHHHGGSGVERPRHAGDPALTSSAGCLLRYDGQLLSLALELGRRLLPAFDTPTGIPFHRVNLGTGEADVGGSRETCTAAGGTFLLEFGLLSRLSGDPLFEAAARRAVAALWRRRSTTTGLVGTTIDAIDGAWRSAHAGVGAGVDSFLEYLPKAAALFDDTGLAAAWAEAASAVSHQLVYADVHLEASLGDGRGAPKQPVVSSLQAFWPGLEVLGGAVGDGLAHVAPLLSLWAKHSALPEAYDVVHRGAIHFARDAPLRPELGESVYHLFTATHDPALLAWAAELAGGVANRSRSGCGFASVAEVATGRLDNRMDSYFIAETTKYALLTFDDALRRWGAGAPTLPPPVTAAPDDGSGSGSSGKDMRPRPPVNAAAPSTSTVADGDVSLPPPSEWHGMWASECGCDAQAAPAADASGDDDSPCSDEYGGASKSHHPLLVECSSSSAAATDGCDAPNVTAAADDDEPAPVAPAGAVTLPPVAVPAPVSGGAAVIVGGDAAVLVPTAAAVVPLPAEQTLSPTVAATLTFSGTASPTVVCTARPLPSAEAPAPRRRCAPPPAPPALPPVAAAHAASWCVAYCAARASSGSCSAALDHPLAWFTHDDVALAEAAVDDAAEAAEEVHLLADGGTGGGGSSEPEPVYAPPPLGALPLSPESLLFTTEGHVVEVTARLQRPGRGYPLAWLGGLPSPQAGDDEGESDGSGSGSDGRTATAVDFAGGWPRPEPGAWSAESLQSLPLWDHTWTYRDGLPLTLQGRAYDDAALPPDVGARAPLSEAGTPASTAASATPHPALLLDPPLPGSPAQPPPLPPSTAGGAMCLVAKLRPALPQAATASGVTTDPLHAPFPSHGTPWLFPPTLASQRPFDSVYAPAVLAAVTQAQADRNAAVAAGGSGVHPGSGNAALQARTHAQHRASSTQPASQAAVQTAVAALLQMQAAAAASALERAHAALARASEALGSRARQLLHPQQSGGGGGVTITPVEPPAQPAAAPSDGSPRRQQQQHLHPGDDDEHHRRSRRDAPTDTDDADDDDEDTARRMFFERDGGAAAAAPAATQPPPLEPAAAPTPLPTPPPAAAPSRLTFTPLPAPEALPAHVRWAVQRALLTHALAVGESAVAGAAHVHAQMQGRPPRVPSLPGWATAALERYRGHGLLPPHVLARLPRPVAGSERSPTSTHLLLVGNASGLTGLVGGGADDEEYGDDEAGDDVADVHASAGADAGLCAASPARSVDAAPAVDETAEPPSLFEPHFAAVGAAGPLPPRGDDGGGADQQQGQQQLPLAPLPHPSASGFLASAWTLTAGGGAPQLPPAFPPASYAAGLTAVPLLASQLGHVVLHCDPLAGSCGIVTGQGDRQAPLALHLHHADDGGDEAAGASVGDPHHLARLPQEPRLSCTYALPGNHTLTAHRCIDGATLALARGDAGDAPVLSWFHGQGRYDAVKAAATHAASVHRGGDASHDSGVTLTASPAAFGPTLTAVGLPHLLPALAYPLDGCFREYDATAAQQQLQPPEAPLLRLLTADGPLADVQRRWEEAGRADAPLVVAVVLRGGCSFAAKARAAHAAGAAAVVVVDADSPDAHAWAHRKGVPVPADAWEGEPTPHAGGGGDHSHPPVDGAVFLMADDGSGTGGDVAIPGAMVSGAAARILLTALAPVPADGGGDEAPPLPVGVARSWPRGATYGGGGGDGASGVVPLKPSRRAASRLRMCLYQPADTATVGQLRAYYGGGSEDGGGAGSVSGDGPNPAHASLLSHALPFKGGPLETPRDADAAGGGSHGRLSPPLTPQELASDAALVRALLTRGGAGVAHLPRGAWAHELGLLPHPTRAVVGVLGGCFSQGTRAAVATSLARERAAAAFAAAVAEAGGGGSEEPSSAEVWVH